MLKWSYVITTDQTMLICVKLAINVEISIDMRNGLNVHKYDKYVSYLKIWQIGLKM